MNTASPSKIENSFLLTLTPPDSRTEKSAAGSVGVRIAPMMNATPISPTCPGIASQMAPPAIIDVRNTPTVARIAIDLIESLSSFILIFRPA